MLHHELYIQNKNRNVLYICFFFLGSKVQDTLLCCKPQQLFYKKTLFIFSYIHFFPFCSFIQLPWLMLLQEEMCFSELLLIFTAWTLKAASSGTFLFVLQTDDYNGYYYKELWWCLFEGWTNARRSCFRFWDVSVQLINYKSMDADIENRERRLTWSGRRWGSLFSGWFWFWAAFWWRWDMSKYNVGKWTRYWDGMMTWRGGNWCWRVWVWLRPLWCRRWWCSMMVQSIVSFWSPLLIRARRLSRG